MENPLLKSKLWIIATGMCLFSIFGVSAQAPTCIVGGTNFDIGDWYICDPDLTSDAAGWLSGSLNSLLNAQCGTGTADEAPRNLSIDYAVHRPDGFLNNSMSIGKGEYPFTLWAQSEYYIPPPREAGSTAIFANPRMANPRYLGRPGNNILVNIGANQDAPFFTYSVSGLAPLSQATITLEAFSLLHNWPGTAASNYGGAAGYNATAGGGLSGTSPSVKIGHAVSTSGHPPSTTLTGTTTTQAITFGNSVIVTHTGTTDANGSITFYVARGNASYRAPIGIDNVIVRGTPLPKPTVLGEACPMMPLNVSLEQSYPSGTTYSWSESVTGTTGTNSNFIFEPPAAETNYSVIAKVTLPGCPEGTSAPFTIRTKMCCEDGFGNPMAKINIYYDDFGYFPTRDVYEYRDDRGVLQTIPVTMIMAGSGTPFVPAYRTPIFPPIKLCTNNDYFYAQEPNYAVICGRPPYYMNGGIQRDASGTDKGGMYIIDIGNSGNNVDVILYQNTICGLCPGKTIYFSTMFGAINRSNPVGTMKLELLNAQTGALIVPAVERTLTGDEPNGGWVLASHEFTLQDNVDCAILRISHKAWSQSGNRDKADYAIDEVKFQVCAPPNILTDASVKGNVDLLNLCDDNDITLKIAASAAIDNYYENAGYLFQYTYDNPFGSNVRWNDLGGIGKVTEYLIADPPSHPLFDGLQNGDKIYFRAVIGSEAYLRDYRDEWESMDALSPCRAISISAFLVEASLNCKRCTAPKDITISSTVTAPAVNSIKTVNLCVGGSTVLTTNNIAPNITPAYNDYIITWYKGNRTTVTGTTANPGTTANSLTVNYADATAAGVKYYVQVVDKELPLSSSCHRWDSIMVIANPAPIAGITNNTATTVLTCATPSISLTATGGATYSWSNGLGSNANATVNAPGTYTVTVADANGCTATASITITENKTPPTAGITNNTGTTELTCTLLSISLTATGGVSYSWDNGLGNSASATATSAGTYTVTVTGANGCTDSKSITITSDKGDVTAGITNNTATTVLTCTTMSISLTATGSGTYAWSNGLGSNADVTINLPGTYTVTLTASNGCTDTESITITENKTPPTAGITSNPSITVLTCTTASISLTATGGGTYSWDNSLGSNANVTVNTAGTYVATVTGSNGCTATASVTITENRTPPTAGITNNASTTILTCTTPNISLTVTGGGTYLWDNSLGSGANATVNAPGTYTVTVTGTNGCTATSSVTITENKTPPTAGITNNTAETVLTCTTPTISLTATGSGTYSWNNSLGSNANVTINTAGTYVVTVTGSNGCTATASITITENKTLPNAVITNNSSTTVLTCTNPSISLTATGGVTYSWNNGLGNDATVTVTAPGTYIVTVTALNSCSNTASITITSDESIPTAAITTNTGTKELTCATPSITLTASGGTSYSWDNGLGNNASITVTSAGTYTVTVTSSNGCRATTGIEITSSQSLPTVNVNNAEICLGGETTLTASGANSYTWTTGETGVAITVSPTATTTYTVEGTATETGCKNTATTTVYVESPVELTLTAPKSIELGNELTITVTAERTDHGYFEWFLNDQPYKTISEYSLTLVPTAGKQHFLVHTATTKLNCPSSSEIYVEVSESVPNAINPYILNSTNCCFMPGYRVEIYNRYMQKVFEGDDGWDGTYRGALADPGTYFYRLYKKGGQVEKGTLEVVKF